MQELVGAMQENLDDRDLHIRADLELHATILRATHNGLLAQLTHLIAEGLEASRDVTVRLDGSMEPAVALHAEVVAAIAAGDGEAAATAMASLVELARQDIRMLLDGEEEVDR
jgi:DNA-binding FadR family transcriptional regulator